jgi:creatinine amidohydrolase
VRVFDLNWMQLEDYLRRDDRIVLPLASTEQHAYLSLGTDAIVAERLAVEAAEPVGVPVLPAQPYGVAPGFAAFPGSPTLRVETFLALVRDLLESLHAQGFRRVLIVNAHGGNIPAAAVATEFSAAHEDAQVLFHSWWISPAVRAVVDAVDPQASHASWLENFPWTRLFGVELPTAHKPAVEGQALRTASPRLLRELVGDGSYGGFYSRPDDEVLEVWRTAVEEVRDLLVSGWRD